MMDEDEKEKESVSWKKMTATEKLA